VAIDTGCQPTEDPGRGDLYEVTGAVGAITDLAYDQRAASCNRLLGKVRDCICADSATSTINGAMSGLRCFAFEVESGEAGISEQEQNIRTLRVRFCVATQ
jgi:hypothetical protein